MQKSVSSVFGISAPPTAMVEVGSGSNLVADENYVFRPWLVKLMMMWWSGRINKRMYLYGPTGSGKSTIIEQFGARMGVPVFRIGVHNRLEFNETLGSVQLVQSSTDAPTSEDVKTSTGMMGKIVDAIRHLATSGVTTKFVHAELGQGLVASATRKVIVLIDEVDQGNPSQNMAWNKLLDECPMTLPTGDVISPDNIWIAATGNTGFDDDRGLYRGTQRQNIAFKSRFGIHEEIGYPEEDVEKAILSKIAIGLPDENKALMVTFAKAMRDMFMASDLDVPLATRTLINWANTTVCLAGMPGVSPMERALELVYSNQCSPDDKQKIKSAWQRVAGATQWTSVV